MQINLTVSKEKVLDYEILQIAIPKQEEGKFLNIVLKIWNKGNVEAKPTRLTMDFWNKFRDEKLETKEIIDFSKIKAVDAFSEGEIRIEVPIEFELDQYWAAVKVYQDEKILKSEDIFFEIVEKGTLPIEVEEGAESKEDGKKFPYLYLFIAIGVVVLAGIGFALCRKRRIVKSKEQ